MPTYIKKEDKHLLEHPLPAGKTVSKVEIHHGDKHYPGKANFEKYNFKNRYFTFFMYSTGYAIQSGSDDSHIFKADDESNSAFAEFQNSKQEDDIDSGYRVQEDYQQQQQHYYPQEALQHHYQYIPKEQIEHQGLSHYYSYPQEALQHTSFHQQPIVVAEQEKS